MTWTLCSRWFGQSKWLLLACGACLFVFCWLRIWMISQLETSSLEVILTQVWEKYEKFSPVPLSQLLTYSGRVALAYEEGLVLLCIAIWAIARGSITVSGHIHSGVMEMLMTQPIRRSQLMLTQVAVTLVGLVLLAACVWGGVAAGIEYTWVTERYRPTFEIPLIQIEVPLLFLPEEKRQILMSERTSAGYFLYPTLNLLCLGVFLAGLTTLVSAWDSMRWRTIGLVVGFVIVQTIMRLLSVTVESCSWLAWGTIFSAYEPQVIASVAVYDAEKLWDLLLFDDQGRFLRPGPAGYNLILLVPGVLAYALATWIFCRRDIPAPV